jgi:heat shock protein HslJ
MHNSQITINNKLMEVLEMKRFMSLETILALGMALILVMGVACTPTADIPEEPDSVIPGDAGSPEPTEPALEPDEPGINDPLAGAEWTLLAYGPEGALIEVPAGTGVTLNFSDGSVTGSAGCNNYFGQYRVSGGELQVGPLGSTEMWCEGKMELEDAYLAILSETETYVLAEDGSDLILVGAAGTLRFGRSGMAAADLLAGSEWVLVEYGSEGDLVAPLPEKDLSLIFEDGAIGGSAGCNGYGADYAVDGETIEFGPIVSTMMWCEDLSDQENAYLAILGEVETFVLAADGSELVLEGPAGLLRYHRPAPVADLPLEGTIWVLETIISGETAQSALAGSTVSLEMDGDRLGGSTGCNFYGTGYSLDGDTITVGMMEVTLQYCSDELMAQEAAYLAALNAAETIALEGERLSIFHPDGALVFKPATHLPLEGSTWVLTGIAKGDAMIQTWIDVEITAEFVDGTMAGSSGCNRYSAGYELDGQSLKIGMAMGTLMACDEERMGREGEFLGALEAVDSYEIKMETLTLMGADGKSVMVFQVATDLPLEGTAWTLQAIAAEDAIVSTAFDSEITATFAEGQVSGSAGCNQYFAGYELEGEGLYLGPVGRTEMACMEVDRMEREDAFLKALEAVAGYSIKMGTLTLTDAAGETLIIFTSGEGTPQ